MTATLSERRCIVTGADANMEGLLSDLLNSLNEAGVLERAHVVVLDLGLSPAMRATLPGRCHEVIDPTGKTGSPMIDAMDLRRAANLLRITMPTLVPGYDTYFWIDADFWVQGPELFDVFAICARTQDIAIVTETDPSYGNIQRRHDWIAYRAELLYGHEAAHRLAIHPCLNAGLFAAQASSPLWATWLDHITQWQDRPDLVVSDQVPLNYLIQTQKLSAYVLPAIYNWMCHAATPKWSMDLGCWMRPLFPHDKIMAMHLASTSRNYSDRITVAGGAETIDLTHATAVRLRRLSSGKSDAPYLLSSENRQTP
jgi:hypothetical protein